MAYRIQKSYYTGLDETRVRLTLQEPYRDFVVSFKGDLSDLSDDILEQRSIAKLAREFNPSNALEELEERVKAQEEASENLIKTFILSKDLSEAQKENILSQYDEWKLGVNYEAGKKVRYKGKVYKVVIPHTSQSDWKPDVAINLFTEYLSPQIQNKDGSTTEVINDFKQPTGAHDAYSTGDKVRFEGKIYECKKDNIVHSPGEYPDGWNLIEV